MFTDSIQRHWKSLSDFILNEAKTHEVINLFLVAEDSDFVRFNNSKVRQSTHVKQMEYELTLFCHNRKVQMWGVLTSDLQRDQAAARSLVAAARTECSQLPEDPFISVTPPTQATVNNFSGKSPSIEALVNMVGDQTNGTQFTGLFAGGDMIRAYKNSVGLDHWFSTHNFFVDYSLYTKSSSGENKAVKGIYAEQNWNEQTFLTKLQESKNRLSLLSRPSRKIDPGSYRCYLAPGALGEIVGMFHWDALSYTALQEGRCPLADLARGKLKLSKLFTFNENFNLGLSPVFNSVGEIPQMSTTLIGKGEMETLLISTRASKKYDVKGNFAESSESPRSAEVLPGTLKDQNVLAQLGTGIYISNLHYLNWSDIQNARVTGMTRYACFWIENGEIIAPISDLRFDESLYQLLGSQLETLTEQTEIQCNTSTYGNRSVGGQRVPGALVSSMKFTL